MQSPSNLLMDTGSQISLIKKSALAFHVQINTSIVFTLSGVAHNETFKSIGQAVLIINVGTAHILQTFQVVPDDFPIKYVGLLGADFCKENGVSLNFFDNKLTITEIQHPIQIQEKEAVMFTSPETPPVTPEKTNFSAFNSSYNIRILESPEASLNLNNNDSITVKARTQSVIKINTLENKIGLVKNDSINLPEGIFIPNTIIESKNNEAFIPILNVNEDDIT